MEQRNIYTKEEFDLLEEMLFVQCHKITWAEYAAATKVDLKDMLQRIEVLQSLWVKLITIRTSSYESYYDYIVNGTDKFETPKHITRLMFEAPFDEMPLHLLSLDERVIAKWRLSIGK